MSTDGQVPNAVEILRKITTAWVVCSSVTDDRQSDRRQQIANVAKKLMCHCWRTCGLGTWWARRESEFHASSWRRRSQLPANATVGCCAFATWCRWTSWSCTAAVTATSVAYYTVFRKSDTFVFFHTAFMFLWQISRNIQWLSVIELVNWRWSNFATWYTVPAATIWHLNLMRQPRLLARS